MQPLGIRAYPLPTDIIDLARRIDQVDDAAKEYIKVILSAAERRQHLA